MNLVNRLKLWGGVLGVLVLLSLLVLLFNQRQNSVTSLSASVEARTSTVASAYGGVVTESLVQDGQHVSTGDKLFTLTSSTLQQDIARGAKPTSTLAYDIDDKSGVITYKAVADGYITDIKAFKGSFVNDGGSLATEVADGSRTVEATYRLAPVDYGRIVIGGPVEVILPNNAQLHGKIRGVTVGMDKGEAVTTITITCPGLDDAGLGILGNRGTPVATVMSLRDDGPLAGPSQAFLGFLTKIGLR